MSPSKLLVVDDDPNICELLRLYFEKEGYQVKTASDGFEGVSIFKNFTHRGMSETSVSPHSNATSSGQCILSGLCHQ